MSEPFDQVSETQRGGSSADDEDRHPRFPGRRRNGQMRKGFSANRKGRPRKARSTRAIFQEMLQSKVPMMVNGKLKKLTVVEAMAARVKREALTGPLRGLEKGVSVAQTYSLPEPAEPEPVWDLSGLDDQEMRDLERLMSKVLGVTNEPQAAPDPFAYSRDVEP